MDDIVIVSAARTPVGSFNGAFATVPAHQLGVVAIKAALPRAGISAEEIDEVILGQVLPAGQGQNPARQAAILAGITRDSIIRLATDMNVRVREEGIARDQLYVADECFLTGTGAEVIPVVKLDGREIGPGRPGPITQIIARKPPKSWAAGVLISIAAAAPPSTTTTPWTSMML